MTELLTKEEKHSEWRGNKQDGIELRYHGDDLDEVVLYRNGECCVHIEGMSPVCYWMSLSSQDNEVHINISSKNLRSHIKATAEFQD